MTNSNTKSSRKNIILHEEKAITHLEQQPNQSRYIENLILSDLISTEFNDIFQHLRKLKQHFNSLPESNNQNTTTINSDIQDSISSILSLV